MVRMRLSCKILLHQCSITVRIPVTIKLNPLRHTAIYLHVFTLWLTLVTPKIGDITVTVAEMYSSRSLIV